MSTAAAGGSPAGSTPIGVILQGVPVLPPPGATYNDGYGGVKACWSAYARDGDDSPPLPGSYWLHFRPTWCSDGSIVIEVTGLWHDAETSGAWEPNGTDGARRIDPCPEYCPSADVWANYHFKAEYGVEGGGAGGSGSVNDTRSITLRLHANGGYERVG